MIKRSLLGFRVADKSIDFEKIKSQVEVLLKESQESCIKGAGATLRFCGHVAFNVIPITWRVIRFKPTAEKFREEVSYPLSDILIKMKDPNTTAKELEKARFEFALFWPELWFKAGALIPKTTVMIGVNVATGMLQTSVKNQPGILGEGRKRIQSLIFKRFKENLSKNEENKHLSLMGRAQFALNKALDFSDFDVEWSQIVEEVKVEMGIDRLEQALALYKGDTN